MPRLLVEKGPDRGKFVTFVAGQQLVVGRDPGASLQISDQMCSRRHFMIASKGPLFGLKDLDSANGTLVNGRRMNSAHRLEFGDTIQIGETLISWLPDEQTDRRGGLIGKELGGYRIERRLGRGAMGTVFMATQLSLGRTVALKVLSPDLTKDPRFCDMFLKEARAAGGLNHSNIIQVYDVGDEGGQYYFSMEYAAKGSVLEELSAQKTLPLPRAIRVVKDACAALDYAERKGLVHRDIKPDNLMVMDDLTVKLGDLGLAMSAHEMSVEQDGVFGTPHYIAPEQAMGKPIDHRADIYALGASFYRMLTGRTLFEGATVKEILKQQVRDAHKPIQTWVPDCPAGIATIVDRMLVKNPAERYQHAADVAADLANFELLASRRSGGVGSALANRPQGLSAEQSQQIAGAMRTRNLVLAVIAACVAVGVLVVVLWMTVLRPETPAVSNEPTNPVASNEVVGNQPLVAPLPAEVAEANERLNTAMILAGFQISQAQPGRTDYEAAIRSLTEALDGAPKAEEAMKLKVRTRRGELEALMRQMDVALESIRTEWESTRQDAVGLAEKFRFRQGADTIAAFIARHEAADPQTAEIVASARKYLEGDVPGGGYPAECQAKLQAFEVEVDRDRRRADSQVGARRLGDMRDILQRVRTRSTDCDDSAYRLRLDALATEIDKLVKLLQEEADREVRTLEEAAFNRCSGALSETLKTITQQVALGRFGTAQRLLKDFEDSDPDFQAYRGSVRFIPITDDLRRRREQFTLELSSLAALRDALPTVEAQREMIKQTPWPAHVAAELGGAGVFIAMDVDASRDGAWSLRRISTTTLSAIASTDLVAPERRQAIAGALAHLLSIDSTLGRKLLKIPPMQSAPAAVGIFALLAEMGCYDDAFQFMKLAWEDPDIAQSAIPLVREYYAWGLLGKLEMASRAKDSEAVNRWLSSLEQFKDTRAYKGRK